MRLSFRLAPLEKKRIRFYSGGDRGRKKCRSSLIDCEKSGCCRIIFGNTGITVGFISGPLRGEKARRELPLKAATESSA